MEEEINHMISVAIIGPESSGKTTLAKYLSEYFETPLVPEFSRDFLSKMYGKYDHTDLDIISKGQWDSINSCKKKNPPLLISDTDLLTIEIWSELKYGKCSKVVLENSMNQKFDFYFLCYPDLPYEIDSLRESPEISERLNIFNLFESKLKDRSWQYQIIQGIEDTRSTLAVEKLKIITT